MTAGIPLEDIQAARGRIQGAAIRTPLVPLNVDDAPADIYLKLENLQPIGSFKLRGAANAIRLAGKDELAQGVWTASAGNMAQGVAWMARRLGLACTVVVPDHAPDAKLAAIRRFGASFVKVPFADWWNIMLTHRFEGQAGFFVHPVSDPPVMAGNGTIGLEIVEDLPDVDAILVPYGGGGLSCGIASAVHALKPGVKILACEVDTAAPVGPSLAAGEPRDVVYTPTFVDGIGSGGVLPDMWPRVKALLDGALAVSVAETAEAVRLLLERNRVVAEGAGAVPVACALKNAASLGAGRRPKIVAIVSGGNIDSAKLAKILKGELP